jgi:hypothetical protein
VSTFDSFALDREHRLDKLRALVRRSPAITPELLTEVMLEACIRFAAYGNATKALFNQLVAHGAWADAVLLLLQFELSQWKVKRILYDDGESGTVSSQNNPSSPWDSMKVRRPGTKSCNWQC